ncbi:MAG: sulfite exporter TauE/SafE family protein [Verrucomicrobia bacterium]|nr:sulfite exporter TauE/SafE family protein [Verrucomicrobiota bacterium]
MPPLPCLLAALCVGLSKSGFPGVSLVTVALMAEAFPARQSTGILLPLLIIGDLCAVRSFRQHTLWTQIARMLPPTIVGIFAGFFLMRSVPDAAFKSVLGWMLLCTVLLQGVRTTFPQLGNRVPNSMIFAWAMGIWAGVSTMVANAAGPIMAVYFIALALPKENLIGTSAWLFLIINVFKLPFSAALGLLHAPSLLLDLALAPLVLVGNSLGKRLVTRIPQRVFEIMLLVSATAAAIKMIL